MFLQVVRKSLVEKCNCHGVSGSCTYKICWMQLQPFRETAQTLKRIYGSARKVSLSANNLHQSASRAPHLVIRRRKHKQVFRRKLKSKEMAYLQKSPDFCDRSQYSPGTSGRKCDRNSTCPVLCCGRGYNTRLVNVTSRCDCNFIWCCDVKCKNCTQTIEIQECK